MKSYIIYKNDEFNEYIVEILNEGQRELLSVEQDLVRQGYVITQVIGVFIKCFKIESEE